MKKKLGRPPISEGDPRVPIRVTIRRSTLSSVERQRRPEESLSACIDRLLSKKNANGLDSAPALYVRK